MLTPVLIDPIEIEILRRAQADDCPPELGDRARLIVARLVGELEKQDRET